MNERYKETRNIIYRGHQFFIKSIHVDGRFWPGSDDAPSHDIESITIEWTHKPIDAMEVSQDLAVWLTNHDYGVTVTLSITLGGMPDEEEPD